jgi:hypothetical protein
MAPRNPKNPIKDISDLVGGWLGGNRGTINPQVARVSRDLGTVAQTIDTFTGGLGAAAGRDVRNFAQGGSLPTNLAKTAAVNLAAGAVGAKAAQVVAKGAGKVVAARANKAVEAITPANPDRVIFHAGSDPSAKGPFAREYKPVDRRSGFPNVHMGTETAAASRQGQRIGMDSEADIPLFRRSAIDRYEIVNPKVVSKRRFMDNAFIDEEELSMLNDRESRQLVQYFDDQPTRKNKVLKYVNEVEDRDEISYLVPKSRVDYGDVVYRGSKEFGNQFREGPYTSPELNRLRDIQTRISANQGRAAAAGATAGVVVPKKKGRGGGAKKR